MTGRRGFTLLEVTVALVISGVVVALGYSAASAGIDTRERVALHQESAESELTTRALISDALRHAVDGIRGGPEVFQLVDRATTAGVSVDSLSFLSRGIVQPFGTSSAWRVVLTATGGRVSFSAQPTAAPANYAILRGEVTGAVGMDVRVLGRGNTSGWQSHWEEPSTTPDAISIHWVSNNSQRPMAPLVARLQLERLP